MQNDRCRWKRVRYLGMYLGMANILGCHVSRGGRYAVVEYSWGKIFGVAVAHYVAGIDGVTDIVQYFMAVRRYDTNNLVMC